MSAEFVLLFTKINVTLSTSSVIFVSSNSSVGALPSIHMSFSVISKHKRDMINSKYDYIFTKPITIWQLKGFTCMKSNTISRIKIIISITIFSHLNPIWNGRGGKNALSLIFFFKYLQNEKKYDFALLWLLVITSFERLCQISRQYFDWLTSYCDFLKGVPKNSKTNFFCKIFQVYIMLKWFFSSEITFSYWYLKINILG